jgi:hypothetical protein
MTNTPTAPLDADATIALDDFAYDELWQAIADATRIEGGFIAISVLKFREAIRALTPVREAEAISTASEDIKLDRPALLAAARLWWANNMPNTTCQNVLIKGDGRMCVYWCDHEESGRYTLPVDFAASPKVASDTAPGVDRAIALVRRIAAKKSWQSHYAWEREAAEIVAALSASPSDSVGGVEGSLTSPPNPSPTS